MSGTDFLICPDGFHRVLRLRNTFFSVLRQENENFPLESLYNLNGINSIFIRT